MKLKQFLLAFILINSIISTWAATVNGVVYDKEGKEPLIGVLINLNDKSTVTGLDGSYIFKGIEVGTYTIVATYMGYDDLTKTITINSDDDALTFDLIMKEKGAIELDEVQIVVRMNKDTDQSARKSEKEADNVTNVVSAKAIEVSPDITVANVVQRVSGLTIERNNNGDGQYAIVRGMDKRYNYTLVNGIKIPSPDNENRYVPLDIFPAELLDRLVVTKSLTPSMEGDAIGGVVDMVMKDAPRKKILNASFSTGYNELFFNKNRPYETFNHRATDYTSPRLNLPEGEVFADKEYYTTENMNFSQKRPMPNIFGSLSWGNRYKDGKLGVVLATSYQNSYRGSDRKEFGISESRRGLGDRVFVSQYQQRRYSTQQERMGIHNKLDYQLNSNHKISLYNVWLRLQNNETRTVYLDELRGIENPTLKYYYRGQITRQRIYNSTLQGEHVFKSWFTADWSLVYSHAKQAMPDNSQLSTVSNYSNNDGEFTGELRWLLDENVIRIWEGNTDRDLASYYNFTLTPRLGEQDLEFKMGGLYRKKDRTNTYDNYTFRPNPGVQEYIPFETNYEDLTWRVTNGIGSPKHVLNYRSYENILANYAQFRFIRWNTQFLGGVRAEQTIQGYVTENQNYPEGEQRYLSVLPSFHIKHMPTKKINIRASYFKSISRPSFLEIIPYKRPSGEEVVDRGGNPDLLPASANNFDVRFEFFPSTLDQLLIGAFYKQIDNPIEYAIFPPDRNNPLLTNTTFMPANFPRAINQGIELDVTKYVKRFGVRANYTFTLSRAQSIKQTWTAITEENYDQLSDLRKQELSIGDTTFLNVTQIRPLQGQSKHLGNFSLLYKDTKNGLDAQLAMVYTGERIAIISRGFETDYWQKAFTQLDFSLEKKISEKLVVFCKINNLLNSPFEMYIKKPYVKQAVSQDLQPYEDETLVRLDYYQRTYMVGLRLKL